MKNIFDKNYLYSFVYKQKCIPWRIRILFSRTQTRMKNTLGLLYDNKFFDAEHRKNLRETSAKPISVSLIDRYNPNSVIDIGCGDGIYLEELRNNKKMEVVGYDNSKEGIKRCRKKGIKARRFNIETGEFSVKKKFDLAICFEVAEHLSNNVSNKLVKLLCQCSNLVIFTAAPPGQGGFHHINEQPYAYWISKFNEMNYYLDINDTEYLKDKWRYNNVQYHMVNNLMVFKKIIKRYVNAQVEL